MTGAEVTRVTEARVVFGMRVSVSPIALLGSSLAALALACSGMTEPTVDARLSLNASSYLAVPQGSRGQPGSYQFTVVAQFRNDGNADVHLSRCYPDSPHPVFAVMLRSSDLHKSSAYDPVWACVGHDNPIVVAPNETRVDTLIIVGPTSWDGQTQKPNGELEGSFQLMYTGDVCDVPAGCRSKPFTVRMGK